MRHKKGKRLRSGPPEALEETRVGGSLGGILSDPASPVNPRGVEVSAGRTCLLEAVFRGGVLRSVRGSTLAVYLALLFRSGHDRTCRVPVDVLAAEVGLGKRTVQRALAGLRSRGLIRCLGPGVGGRKNAIAYTVVLPLCADHPPACQQAGPQVACNGRAAPEPVSPVTPFPRETASGMTPFYEETVSQMTLLSGSDASNNTDYLANNYYLTSSTKVEEVRSGTRASLPPEGASPLSKASKRFNPVARMARELGSRWRGISQATALAAVKAAIRHTSARAVQAVISGLQEETPPDDPVAALVARAKAEFARTVLEDQAATSVRIATGWEDEEAVRHLLRWATERGIPPARISCLAQDLRNVPACSVLSAIPAVRVGLYGLAAWREMVSIARRPARPAVATDSRVEEVRQVVLEEYKKLGLVIFWQAGDDERAAAALCALERTGVQDPVLALRKAVRRFLRHDAASAQAGFPLGWFWRSLDRYVNMSRSIGLGGY